MIDSWSGLARDVLVDVWYLLIWSSLAMLQADVDNAFL